MGIAAVLCAAGLPALLCQADDRSRSFLESSRASAAPAHIDSDAPLWDPGVSADLTWFDNKEDFEAATGAMICRQDFEESTLSPGRIVPIDDELTSGVPCEPKGCPFPIGLEGCEAMTYQSNTLGGEPVEPSPGGGAVLDVLSVGFAGATSDLIIMDRFQMSADVLMDRDDVQGFGATPGTFQGGGTVEIRVYDVDNNFLGMNTVPANPAGSRFFGVISDGAAIGRVNGFDPIAGNNGAEGLDNIQIHQAGGGQTTCTYLDKKVRARRGCDTCPEPRGCQIASKAECESTRDCQRKIKVKVECPNDPDARCKIVSKRCACG